MPEENTTTKIFFGLINMTPAKRNTAYSIVIMVLLGYAVNRLWMANEASHKREYDSLMKLYEISQQEKRLEKGTRKSVQRKGAVVYVKVWKL